ncbi:MAG: hypothetical protein JNM67_02075 [Bacteroidetes bacterium]|nr:hypothetical protein [Bacteroidota bacterium]
MKTFFCTFSFSHSVAIFGIVCLSVSMRPSQTYAQSFTLNDLIEIVNAEDRFFDTMVVKKGYVKFDNQGEKGRYYKYKEPTNKNEYYIYKSYFVDQDVTYKGVKVTFQSCDTQDSIIFKSGLKKMHFKYIKTLFDTSEYGNIVSTSYYRKSKIDFIVRSGKLEDGGVVDENTNVYVFRVTKQTKIK